MSELVRVNVNFPAIGKALQDAVRLGVARATEAMGEEMRKMLSKPGRGRVYLLRNKAGGRGEKILREAGSPLTKTRFFAYTSRFGLAAALRQRRRDGRRNPKTLRSIGFHKASAPGDPPAVNTGHLRRSWQVGKASTLTSKVQKSGNAYRLVVGSNVKYARWLEFGTKSMAARPYVRPVAQMMRTLAPQIISRTVSEAVARYGGRASR